jgi:hypothetical protein
MASDSQARHRDLNSDPAVIELQSGLAVLLLALGLSCKLFVPLLVAAAAAAIRRANNVICDANEN